MGQCKRAEFKKAWNKVLCIGENPQTECINKRQEDMSEMINMLKKLDYHECDEEEVQQWMDIDDEDPGYQIKQDIEILDPMTNKADSTASTSSTTSSDDENESIISVSETFHLFKTLHCVGLKHMLKATSRKRVGFLRQTKIEDFFKHFTDYPKIPVFRTSMCPN
ncbi:hypothetical protein WA026_019591 [Henosepilachna vigintioctopunctata]|uniref:Uncharacterized protein n=1 Tax=Henosepilachna vigintioctopunctata TaxID=420089 RepID=A0AAW1TXJ2_9CUCU